MESSIRPVYAPRGKPTSCSSYHTSNSARMYLLSSICPVYRDCQHKPLPHIDTNCSAGIRGINSPIRQVRNSKVMFTVFEKDGLRDDRLHPPIHTDREFRGRGQVKMKT